AMLRDVASRTWEADQVDEAYALAAAALAGNPRDIPFALLYRLEPGRARAVLKGAAGIAAGHALAPETIDFPANAPWPLADMAVSREELHVETPAGSPCGPWSEPPGEVVLIPLASGGLPHGVMVVGVNPYRARDGVYDDFLRQAARKITAAI